MTHARQLMDVMMTIDVRWRPLPHFDERRELTLDLCLDLGHGQAAEQACADESLDRRQAPRGRELGHCTERPLV